MPGRNRKDWTQEINALLDSLDAKADPFIHAGGRLDDPENWKEDEETPYWAVVMMVFERAAEQADQGNIKPLQRALSYFAGRDMSRFLRLPKLGRGKKFPKANDPVSMAALTYQMVMKCYKGEKDRPKGADVKKIVAARHKVTVHQVESKLQNPSKLLE
jgi:hypothetical protein